MILLESPSILIDMLDGVQIYPRGDLAFAPPHLRKPAARIHSAVSSRRSVSALPLCFPVFDLAYSISRAERD